MASANTKKIIEYTYCAEQRKAKDFSTQYWINNERQQCNYYTLITNNETFKNQSTRIIYSFVENGAECNLLRRNAYLLKVANAITFFGKEYIILDLNEFCRTSINENSADGRPGYSVPEFRQWHDVTKYIGDRDSPRIPAWEREKKQKVYDQITRIANNNGICDEYWEALKSLYDERNLACHAPASEADAESIKIYANYVNNEHEKQGVNCLSDLVLTKLGSNKRGRK
ncbi:unnamed protein product [Adineta ricciae]|uniref:Uncharacterized protein n=1 Tax=Adineta ricciae TaxID=249248 RepID=A0A816E8B4_ADIRI|nr:unnamed protein product [Adineta ricciae]CAF1649119.1 unnamed protein product [Adineta ricciae]